MFSWFMPDKQGLVRISEQFGEMLASGRKVFDEATATFLQGGDAKKASDSVRGTDRGINRLEQVIRRELVVHLTVGAGADAHLCLRMMSLVKDAERIGDYAKNILDLTIAPPGFDKDPRHAELVALQPKVSSLLERMQTLYDKQDESGARAYCDEVDVLLHDLDDKVDELIKDGSTCSHPVAAALMYRYYKRVVAHAANVVTAVFMSVDKLDYFDEDPADRC